MNKEHYKGIEFLRVLCCIGVIMTHVKANSNYHINGYLYNTVFLTFEDFVFLFMAISAFGLCCGYYDKVINGTINFVEFYKKRFIKILPFFGLLALIDLIVSPSLNALYEFFADITLLFGFLPNIEYIQVMGVGWYLGLVFVFYLIFPFYCVLIKDKKMAWFSFIVSLIFNYATEHYFMVTKANILYSGCYFILGGLVFLYRDKLREVKSLVILSGTLLSIIIYYIVGDITITRLLVSFTLLTCGISKIGDKLSNKVISFFSNISMELYLSSMPVFRGLEKLHINTLLGDRWAQYIFMVITVFLCSTIFSVIVKKIINITISRLKLA